MMKKMMKKTLAVCLVVSLLCPVADSVQTTADSASKPALSKSWVSVPKGTTKSLTVKRKPSGAVCKWSSSNKAVASVTNKGKISGKKLGSATITCKVTAKKPKKKTYTLKCKVLVTPKDKTGYKPQRYVWEREGTEGYSLPYLTPGKYVRADGKAVLYIRDWDTGESFTYELYAVAKKAGQMNLMIPDGRESEFAFVEVDMYDMKKATDSDRFIYFSDNGKHIVTVKSNWEDELYDVSAAPDGKYYLVREK